MASEIEIYIAYSAKDKKWSKELINHLISFRREGLMVSWHTGEILPGQTESQEIDYHLTSANIILLLISADFLASDHHWRVEVSKAMERHKAKEALVIPIILRHVEWQYSLLAHLNPLPENREPIVSKSWKTPDEALQNVAQSIHKAILELRSTTKLRSPLWHVPYPQNPFFTGRRSCLISYLKPFRSVDQQQLHNLMLSVDWVVLAKHKPQLNMHIYTATCIRQYYGPNVKRTRD